MPEAQADSERERNFQAAPGILERIVRTKEAELERLVGREVELRAAARSAPDPRSFREALRREGEVALIAEIKRRSPGAGEIRPGLVPAELARAYADAGAAALSVLTDEDYFGGSLADLREVRERVDLPILRKDFTIDVRQLWEARASGADAVLLIARILDDEALGALHREAEDLGMDALVEVHDASELARALRVGASLIGINNRDLSTFRTRLEVTLELLPGIPATALVVSESGIRSGDDVARLGQAGIDAVLVGETLLRHEDPGFAAAGLAGRTRSAARTPP